MLVTVSAALEGVNLGRVLLDLTIILLVAKLAAEASDRIRIPAVIGEIAAGIVIGPSVLGLVSASDMLFVLAEFGVIFLIQVGLETDVAELRSVGRASMLVAVIGVSLPMALGIGVGLGIGESTNTSLFIGAALTATSIGITARVFGDLRALATVEARTVLGAAVVDDVLGLIILTVVTRIVDQGSVGIGTIATTIGLAVAKTLGNVANPITEVTIKKPTAKPIVVAMVPMPTEPCSTIRVTTVRMMRPSTSSTTAAPSTVRASTVASARKSPNTRAVIPILVAVKAAPMNRDVLVDSPIAKPTPTPSAIGNTTPITATSIEARPTLRNSATSVSKPT